MPKIAVRRDDGATGTAPPFFLREVFFDDRVVGRGCEVAMIELAGVIMAFVTGKAVATAAETGWEAPDLILAEVAVCLLSAWLDETCLDDA
jgi:hypothetical protein